VSGWDFDETEKRDKNEMKIIQISRMMRIRMRIGVKRRWKNCGKGSE
jgi:hypothetical protein